MTEKKLKVTEIISMTLDCNKENSYTNAFTTTYQYEYVDEEKEKPLEGIMFWADTDGGEEKDKLHLENPPVPTQRNIR